MRDRKGVSSQSDSPKQVDVNSQSDSAKQVDVNINPSSNETAVPTPACNSQRCINPGPPSIVTVSNPTMATGAMSATPTNNHVTVETNVLDRTEGNLGDKMHTNAASHGDSVQNTNYHQTRPRLGKKSAARLDFHIDISKKNKHGQKLSKSTLGRGHLHNQFRTVKTPSNKILSDGHIYYKPHQRWCNALPGKDMRHTIQDTTLTSTEELIRNDPKLHMKAIVSLK